jgi:hypothetical protein
MSNFLMRQDNLIVEHEQHVRLKIVKGYIVYSKNSWSPTELTRYTFQSALSVLTVAELKLPGLHSLPT